MTKFWDWASFKFGCAINLKHFLPSSLSFRVMPMGSSVFLWNWTNRTRVTFSRLLLFRPGLLRPWPRPWPSRPLRSGSWSLRGLWTGCNMIRKPKVNFLSLSFLKSPFFKALYFVKLYSIFIFVSSSLGSSTCPLVFGCCELSHVIFLKLRKKELLAKLSKFTKWQPFSLKKTT